MFRMLKKNRSKKPRPPRILPVEYTGYHWPEREDDNDPVRLPESWFPLTDSSPENKGTPNA